MKKTLILTGLLLTLSAVFAPQTFALTGNPSTNPAPQYTALEPLPCIPGGSIKASDCPGSTAGTLQTTFNFQNYVQYFFNLIIALAAAAAVFMIVYGGFQYMTTDSWNGKSEGVNKLKNSLLGLLLVLTSYLILRTVDPRLVAISSTLVKPLDIDYSHITPTAQLLDQLNSIADQALQQATQNASDAVAARNAVSQDQQDVTNKASTALAALQAYQRGLNPPLPESAVATSATIDSQCRSQVSNAAVLQSAAVAAACGDYLSAVDKVKTDTGALYVSAVKSSIDKIINQCTTDKTLDAETCATNINVATQNGVSTLTNQLSMSPQAIYDYAQYANGSIDATNYGKNWAGDKLIDSDYGQIISSSQQYLDKITDPAIKAKLIQARDNVIINILKGSQQSINDGTYLKAYQDQSNTPTYSPGI